MDKKALLLAVGVGLGVLGISSLPGLLRGCKSDTKPVKQLEVNNIRCIDRYVESTSYTHYSHDSDKGLLDQVVYHTEIDTESSTRVIRVMTDGGPDGENDGLVDFIAISNPESYLLRKKDYIDCREEFDRADKLLAEVKRRAKESGYPPEAQKIKGFHNAIENSFYLDGWVWDESLKDYVPRKK